MNKKIFLLFVFFMASIFIKAQVQPIEYPANTLNEEKIREVINKITKDGATREEIERTNNYLRSQLKLQQDYFATNGSWQQKAITPPPSTYSVNPGCLNVGFENDSTTGWTFFSGSASGKTLPCGTCFTTPGGVASEVTSLTGPQATTTVNTVGGCSCSNASNCTTLPYTAGVDGFGNFPVVAPAPLGGNHSLLLNNSKCGYRMAKAQQSFVVNPSNINFTFMYAIVLQSANHAPTAVPYFWADVFDNTTNSVVPCTQYSITTSGNITGFSASAVDGSVYTKPWTTVNLDLSGALTHTVTVEFMVSDCNAGGHFGYAYIDAVCSPNQITRLVPLCPGQNAVLSGPPGMASYAWSPGGATTQNITTSTVANYTLVTTSITGCPAPTLYYNLTQDPDPVPNFSTSNPPCSGSVTFTDGSTIAAPDNITNWVWNYGDGSASVNATTAANQSHAYTTPGNYTVTLTDTTNNKCAATYTFVVSAGGGGPNPSFSSNSPATAPQCLAGNNVTFTNASTVTGSVTITGYNWDFGDGTTATSTTVTPNTSHSYTASGTYVVTLTVNVTGCSSTTQQTVVISPMPTAIISAPPVCLGAATVFTSTITNGSTYVWDYGDPVGTAVAGNATPNHTYATANTFAVTLTVTSAAPASCTVTATTNVIVSPVPSASFSVAPVCMGTPSFFDATASVPAVGATYSWNFGGAAPNTDVVTAQTDNHTYSASGTFPVTLLITVGTCTATTTGNAVVNPFPLLGFTADHPCDGTAMNLTNTTTNQATISNWSWDFGDATPLSTVNPPPPHTYSAAGCYSVVLTATASTGCSGSHDTVVYIHSNPLVDFTTWYVCLGDTSKLVDSSFVQNPACLNDHITSWNYDLGDGTVLPFTSATLPDTIRHVYAACGPVAITATVTTNNGCTNINGLTGDTIFCLPTVVGPIDFSVCPSAATPIQTFTTTCANGGSPYCQWGQFSVVTGAPPSYLFGNPNFDMVPSYGAVAQNLSCSIIQDTVFAVAISGFGCLGNVTYYIANVYPTPTVSPVNSATVCTNIAVPAINFTGCPVATETFSWTATGDNVGLAATGNGNIASFPGQNATDMPAIGTVSVTPLANGCVGPGTTFSITVNPIPVLTVTSPSPYCPGDIISSTTNGYNINTDPVGGVTYTWTATNNAGTGMPAGGTGVAPNTPYNAPANPSQVDQNSIITYTPSLAGCIGLPITETVTVKPTPTMVAMTDQFWCPAANTTPVPFSVNPTPTGTSVVTYTYSYNAGGGVPATGSTNPFPSLVTTNPGLITLSTIVTVTPTLDGCVGPPSGFTIFVYPNPIAKFSSTNKVCDGFPMSFTDLSKPNTGSITVNQWAWDMNSDGAIDMSTQNPTYTYPLGSVGTNSVTLYIGTNSAPSCTAQVTEPIYINPNPIADFVGDSLKSCPTLHTLFKNLTTVQTPTTGISYVWTFGNGHTSTAATPPQQTYTNGSATQSAYYNISLTATTDSGCVNTKTKNNYIQVFPRPIANFAWGPTDADIDEPNIIFTNEALGVGTYTAAPLTYGPNGVQYYLDDIYASNSNVNTHYGNSYIGDQFSHTYEHYDTATYNVTQWVINKFGCKDEITKPVHIGPNFTFYIPNAFSPNGDGTNEGFKGLGVGIDNTTYNLWVFDRWGLMIFYANDIDKSWDGHMKGDDSKPVLMEDVYVWKVKFNDFTGKKHEYHGTVTLLK